VDRIPESGFAVERRNGERSGSMGATLMGFAPVPPECYDGPGFPGGIAR